jgi:hypothetical protein
MLRFAFKPDVPLLFKNAKDADPQAIGEALTRIKDQHGGLLTADDTWEVARNRRHPLHKHIEWDLEAAAKAHQLSQCRALIRIIRVVDTDRDEKSRHAFVNVTDNENGRAYRSSGEILDSRSLQMLVLEQAERDLRAWEARYSDLLEICEMVRQARLRLAEMRDSGMEARPE